MKVLYFHQHFSTPRGAVATRSYEMARRLLARGHQVTVVCGSYAPGKTGLTGPFVRGCRRGVVDGIEVVEFDISYSNSDSFPRRVVKFLVFAVRSISVALRERYDLVFATSTPLTAGIPGICARWVRGKPFVFEVRDLWPELPREMGVIRNPLVLLAMSLLEWLCYHSAHRLIGLAPGIVEGIIRRGVRPERVALIPNGCDLHIFASSTQPWRPVQVPNDALMAVYAGTHGIANGLNAVLDAAAELKRRGRDDICLVLVGEGMLKPALQARAEREKLHNVIFLDPVEKTRLAGLLAGADLGLQILANVPAFYNGTSPNKFFDYIAAGLPVLINYPGWVADLIAEADCGFVVPPDDPGAFADALEQAADDRAALKRKGANARKLAEERFSRDKLAQDLERVLLEALDA